MKAYLILEDGTVFQGESYGVDGEVVGEVVFNTGMTGYQEILTDPSYFGQIVTMTYPLVGNYGINVDDIESNQPQVKGFIVRELCKEPSNWRSKESLNDFLKRNDIVVIEGIDTRAITRIIREKGSIRGVISTSPNANFETYESSIKNYRITNPVNEVSTKDTIHYEGKGYRVAVLDFGIKQNIVRSLLKRDCEVFVLPAHTNAKDILDIKPQGLLLSNGPGDPKDCTEIIETLKEIQGKVPIFGICLGHQLLALANNGDTEKLKYGHRGCNHPVKDIEKELTYITSQNHGYTIVESSLDLNKISISHININDNTIEGLRYTNIPAFSVQFHPEASPGPSDTGYLFDEFMKMIKEKL